VIIVKSLPILGNVLLRGFAGAFGHLFSPRGAPPPRAAVAYAPDLAIREHALSELSGRKL
jgi:hypothetical protein